MSLPKPRTEHHFFAQLASHQSDQVHLDKHLSNHKSNNLGQAVGGFIVELRKARPVVSLWFWALAVGMLLGGLTMIGLLSYSGERPINFLWLLLFFIVFPLLIMSASWLLILSQKKPPSFWHQLPVLKKLHVALLMPPVRFYLHWLNQWAGLGYSLGGIIVFMVVVTGQDLAFGWASTLAVSPEQFHTLTHVLSLPWQSFAVDAVPSVALIESSQFYQWQAKRDELDPNLLRQWWSFIAMTLVVYGGLVRLLSLFVSHLLLTRSLTKHWPLTPFAKAWQADQEAAKHLSTGHPRHQATAAELQPLHIGWRLSSKDHRLIELSLGLESLARDQNILKQMLAQSPKQLTVWVKAFDSPQAELDDLLLLFTDTSITLALFSPSQPVLDAAYISWERFADTSSLSMSVTEVLL